MALVFKFAPDIPSFDINRMVTSLYWSGVTFFGIPSHRSRGVETPEETDPVI